MSIEDGRWPSDLPVDQMHSGELRLLKGTSLTPAEAIDSQNGERMDTDSELSESKPSLYVNLFFD